MKRRANHEGTYENLPGGKVRMRIKLSGKRIVGPVSRTKNEARRALDLKLARLSKAPELTLEKLPCLADVMYRKLAGPWKHELSRGTWNLYHHAFRAHVELDPIGRLEPGEITTEDLEEWRGRLLEGRGPRTVQAYMRPVLKILKLEGNPASLRLGRLKLPPIKKQLLERADRETYLSLMPTERIRLAVKLMLHGLSIAEVCGLRAEHFDGTHIRVQMQRAESFGVVKDTDELKRPRRYRSVPCSQEVAGELARRRGELFPGLWPSNLRRDIREALKDTRFERIGPHDLRSTAAKWMLDAGAKLSDVASILGNDPKVLLMHYDQSDEEGKKRAIAAIG